ncbi:MAG: cytochrome c [Gammaproteobacteria bacterium]|nr:cytochrome c [Gammaproteobacteria bacterium]
MKYLSALLIFCGVAVLGVGGFIYSGAYQIGADVPHTTPVSWVLEILRERSIERAARDIPVPELDDSQLLLAGGPDYNEMCSGCHLEPGRTESDMSVGLYPAPPDLTTHDEEEEHGETQAAARQFWIIKHGIKATGMPAWGPTHDDQRIWAMVAFLQKLPELSELQYQILTARGEDDSGHAH